MPQHHIATIIPFCTNDRRFLKPCIDAARTFSEQIILVACDHTFDGKTECIDEIEEIASCFGDCEFYLYPFVKDLIPKKEYERMGFLGFWHTMSRWLGIQNLKKEIEYVLFLDTDEIVSPTFFMPWLDLLEYQNYQMVKLANYWYFREPTFQAKKWEDSVVLARKQILTRNRVLQKGERNTIYDYAPPKRARYVMGKDQKPMIHHYSWVRTKEEMLKKVTSWGHMKDRDWPSLVEEEFSRTFSGKDFVHGYEYLTVPPLIDMNESWPDRNPSSQLVFLSGKDLIEAIEG